MSFNKDALLHKLQDEADKWEEEDDISEIENEFDWLVGTDDPCNIANITIDNSISSIMSVNMGDDDDYNPGF